MNQESRIARLHRVRKHERDVAATQLRVALRAREQAQDTAAATRSAREMAEQAAKEAAQTPQAADEWVAQRALVDARLERERLADLQVRRLGRQEALRRVDLRAALVREEQMKLLGTRLKGRRASDVQRSEQKELDDLRRKGGDGR